MLEAARARYRALRDEGIVAQMFLYCQGLVRGGQGNRILAANGSET